MHPSTEINLDFDQSVSTEDRFAIRRFLQEFVNIVNDRPHLNLKDYFSEATVIHGFADFVIQKPQLLEMLYKKFFSRKNNFVRFPKLKLSFTKYLFHLQGTYEEYLEGILSTEGDIELLLIKNLDKFQFVSIKFSPRMRLIEDYE